MCLRGKTYFLLHLFLCSLRRDNEASAALRPGASGFPSRAIYIHYIKSRDIINCEYTENSIFRVTIVLVHVNNIVFLRVHRERKHDMKKKQALAIIIASSMALSIVGCSGAEMSASEGSSEMEMTEEEKRRELDYRTSTVISPMFGVQEKKEEKPGRRQSKKPAEPEKIPDLADIQSSSKSVLGTVFSPLYGDKDASDNIPHDDIDPAVADLSVEDFIEEKKVEKPVEKVTETVEEPVREKLADRPDLIVSPFGVKENPNREKLNDDQYYENISLFDLEDK